MVPIVVLGLAVVRALHGRTTTLFLVVPFAKLTVSGQRTPGWVHRDVHGTWAYVTLNAPGRRESFGLYLRPTAKIQYSVQSCGPWTAPRFPVFLTSEYGPPCMGEAQSESKLVAKPGHIEFDAEDGRRVSVRW
jgi:hypothetical protein